MSIKNLVFVLAIFVIQGCATGAKPTAMVSQLTAETIINDSSKLFQAIEVLPSDGGKETNPAWTSQISNDAFTNSLVDTLKLHSMYGEESSPLKLQANLIELKQPVLGFDMTVTSTVSYTVTESENETTYFSTTVKKPFTATVGDAFLGVKRLRLANEGSIRENIKEFINQLIDFSEGSESD